MSYIPQIIIDFKELQEHSVHITEMAYDKKPNYAYKVLYEVLKRNPTPIKLKNAEFISINDLDTTSSNFKVRKLLTDLKITFTTID